jgi:alpha-beta hydrolase superfamily lysophospholipase
MLKIRNDYVPNGAGWELAVSRWIDPDHFVPGRRPVLVIPGYGMNSFIFGYHPRGPSLLESWVSAGFEAWTVDFRNQGNARRAGGVTDYRLDDIACTDLKVTIDHVLANTETGADRVDGVGCSLGGTYLFVHLACVPDHRLGSVVSMGAPLRWEQIHPLLALAFRSTWLAGNLRFSGTRELAHVVFPLLIKVPKLLSIYLHTSHTDCSNPRELCRTVEDPNPVLNREISLWLRGRDLVVRGQNVTEAMHTVDRPLLAVIANADGIVPEKTALSCYEHWGSADKEVLRVGDETTRFAHADLFISSHAPERVFAPIARWLAAHNAG